MATSQDLLRQAPKTGPWIIGYVVSLAVVFGVTGSGLVTDVRIGMLFWVPIIASVVMIIYTSWRRHRSLGTLSAASRTFWLRMVSASILMFAGFAISGLVWQNAGTPTQQMLLLGLIPYVGFIGMIWSVHQYIVDERDEYLRMQAVRQTLIASFTTLSVAALWGGLAYAKLISSGWIGIVILIWFGGLGLGRLYNEMRP